MRDGPRPPFPDTRLLRSLRSQWLAALLSVLAAITVLSSHEEKGLSFSPSTQPGTQGASQP